MFVTTFQPIMSENTLKLMFHFKMKTALKQNNTKIVSLIFEKKKKNKPTMIKKKNNTKYHNLVH